MFTNEQFDRMPEGAFQAASTMAERTAEPKTTGEPPVRITPLARRIAADRGIDIERVQGGGISGRVYSGDLDNVINFPKQNQSVPEPEPGSIFKQPAGAPEQATPVKEAMVAAVIAAEDDIAGVMRMSQTRRDTAYRTAKSSFQTAAVTQHAETDVTDLIAMRDRLNTNKEPHELIPLKAFYIKAMALSVREKERFRLRLADAEDAYLLIGSSNIGLMIDTGDGITTPVIRDADIKSLEEISAEILLFTEMAKRSGIPDEATRGSAITLIDKGDSGINSFTPIINQPEAAILGVGSVYKRLIMTERSIENRRFVTQSLTYDHRIVNGTEADEFQRLFKTFLEKPGSLDG